MAKQVVGSEWLKQHLGLAGYQLTKRSFIGTQNKTEMAPDGTIDQQFGSKYIPTEDSMPAHLEFLLKYDDLNLDFLSAVFAHIDEQELIPYILRSPSGKYSRKLGFLYEWLTGKQLDLYLQPNGNYVDLLDEVDYVTGKTVKNSRWRINDNLLGGPKFCPIVRRTEELEATLLIDYKAEIEDLKQEFSPEVFKRATQYLYRKETKSSYEIESEKPSPERVDRFIAILYQAGTASGAEVLGERGLTALQNAIVDPRYAQPGFRDFQNFIGQTSYRMEEIYHYICPPPDMVQSMMVGLIDVEEKTVGEPAVVRAAIIAFGFVFIHPFEDGNGRIHRFLIHDMLTRDGLAEHGLIIPVSAHMVDNMGDYDAALESYSKPLMQRIKFSRDEKGEVTITNPEEVNSYFRYPDLTAQSTYLAKTIQNTIRQDLSEELQFLERYDELKRELQNLIDMPDRRLNDIIVFLHQNRGVFPKRRRKNFEEITEEEFEKMERIYSDVFNNN
ncbi:Fic family protein [Pedobacter nyackensis]|uniref:Fic/DOC family protein n=1 Tax=Pedobacter nyackensis TaxID=475255 RepID=A0A1W2C2T8_9SPHI|nr:Fic family protein [Pedobacter nyackensis]SMC79493.1 Fic/DOC family protein [Pedobacter nyackensis]